MSTPNIEVLRGLAEAAAPQNIDTAEIKRTFEGGEHMECPVCQGEGHVELESEYCNYDNTAIGVEFYGIGKAHGTAEAYFRAANPATIIALLDTLTAQAERIKELEAEADAGCFVHGREMDTLRTQLAALQGDDELPELPEPTVRSATFTAIAMYYGADDLQAYARQHAAQVRTKMVPLEKDAARYRWLRMRDWFDGPLCVLRDPQIVLTRASSLGADCPSRDRLDAAIDAAMGITGEPK